MCKNKYFAEYRKIYFPVFAEYRKIFQPNATTKRS